MTTEKTYAIADLIVRVALGIVFLVSAVGKIFFGMIPPIDKILPFIPLNVGAYLLGLLELVVAVLLIAGLFTRIAGWIVAGLLVTFMVSGLILGIFIQAGLVKDIVLFAAAVSIGMIGCSKWGLDCMFQKQKAKGSA